MQFASFLRRRSGGYPVLVPVIASLVLAIGAGTRSATAQALNDEQLLAAMISTVVAHDLGIPIGLLPFPATQLVGEAAQYSGNIALKAYRPWLKPPPNVARFPHDDGDACSFSFYLPNNTATYENMFGIIPIRAQGSQFESADAELSDAESDVLGTPSVGARLLCCDEREYHG